MLVSDDGVLPVVFLQKNILIDGFCLMKCDIF